LVSKPGEILSVSLQIDNGIYKNSAMESAGEGGAWGIALLAAYMLH
jgi:hypothetical protein